MNESIIVQAMLLCKGVSRRTVYKVYNSIPALTDTDEVLKRLNGTVRNVISKSDFTDYLSQSSAAYENALAQGVNVICIADSSFPKRLKVIEDPPVILYVRGDLSPFINGINVAIIGTREPTFHGAKIAKRLAEQFTIKGCNVVSGLAIGCDTFAHTGALSAGGKTMAVLPGGVDKVYPASNRKLAEDMVANGGALISEYPLGVKPFRSYYVERDRLQSAFSEVVVVVETDVVGGSMHTVGYALKQNKILAAYKHPDKFLNEPKCQGNIKLISNNEAIPIENEASIDNLVEKARLSCSAQNNIILNPEPLAQQLTLFN